MGKGAEDLSFIVVEDNAFQRTVAIKILEAMGSTQVLGAENGQDALEQLAACDHPIDITISDLDMPGMDGVEFMRHLAEQKLCGAVAVASGMDAALIRTVEDLVEQHGLFVLGHIEKPLNKDKVQVMLNTFFMKQKARNPDTYVNDISIDDIQQALNDQQFKVWYQPKVQLTNGRWCAVEALARWEHPDQGIIHPQRFIALLESHHLIHELTWQQIHILVADLKAWLNEGRNITMSVNLSPAMLDDVTLPEKIVEIVTHHQVPPENIVLEITESVVIQNIARSLETIARLKLKGFLLSIDDFGTGYSSLQQLSRIPFSELKIDQSFVHDSPENSTRQAIIEANIELAKKLKLKTVAEGIETEKEWCLLKKLGCDLAQGFFVSEAIPKEQLNSWHSHWLTKINQLDY